MEQRDFLEHHGIKGQRWGIRRTPEQLGRLIGKGKDRLKKYLSDRKEKRARERYKKPKRIRSKKMSTEVLEERIKRLKLEDEYKKLSRSTRSRGKNLVLDILESSGKNIGTQLTTYGMGVTVNKIFDSLGWGKDLVNPKKGQKDK